MTIESSSKDQGLKRCNILEAARGSILTPDPLYTGGEHGACGSQQDMGLAKARHSRDSTDYPRKQSQFPGGGTDG